MITYDHIVFVVDDDFRVLEAVCGLLESHGVRVEGFSCAGDFLGAMKPDVPSVIVLDVELPDMSGLELQGLIENETRPPIVFITGHGDVPSSVQAMKRGALDFLTKPFSDVELVSLVEAGLQKDAAARRDRRDQRVLRDRYSQLTPRERDVLPLVVSGMLNKQAAAVLGISEVTLQLHRRSVMQKMEASSLADLVRQAERLRLSLEALPDKRAQ